MERAVPKSQPLLVAIVGGSGAGKTWLAKKLQSALAPDAIRLSLDDFYRDRSHLPPARRAKMNFDHPRAIDWPEVERTLGELRAGHAATLPCYNFKTHCRLPGQSVLAPKPVVLMDGLWLLLRPSLRGAFGLKIFIDCPAQTRRRRRLARDLRSRGRTRAAVLEQLRKTVEPMHARFVAPQEKWADIVLRRDFGEREIRQLAGRLREHLNALPAIRTRKHRTTNPAGLDRTSNEVSPGALYTSSTRPPSSPPRGGEERDSTLDDSRALCAGLIGEFSSNTANGQ